MVVVVGAVGMVVVVVVVMVVMVVVIGGGSASASGGGRGARWRSPFGGGGVFARVKEGRRGKAWVGGLRGGEGVVWEGSFCLSWGLTSRVWDLVISWLVSRVSCGVRV